jgi:hypothetical protein
MRFRFQNGVFSIKQWPWSKEEPFPIPTYVEAALISNEDLIRRSEFTVAGIPVEQDRNCPRGNVVLDEFS